MKLRLKKRPGRGFALLTLAVMAAFVSSEMANAEYWNRNRNRNGNGNGNGGNNSSRDLDRDGIPNISDPDVDNDGIPNGEDRNVDGGIAISGPLRGTYVGDRLPNDHPGEKDIDDDGLDDDSSSELDIDGDGKNDDSPDELDIDGDGRNDDSPDELDIDGDGLADDNPSESDIDGDGRGNSSDDDVDGDGLSNSNDSNDDGDSSLDDNDSTPRGGQSAGGTTGGGSTGGPVNGGVAPASLTGVTYIVRQPNGVIEANLVFSTASGGSENDPNGDIDPFSYTYTANGTTASLRLQFKPDKWDEYDLNYATGGYTRREFKNNTLDDTDTGTFSVSGAGGGGTPPPPPPPAPNGGTAPASLAGVTYVVRQNNGAIEANLVFTTATNGSENDPDGDIDPFTYVYSANGTTATLRLNFKPGKWDEYDLNFATGTYTRREFKNNALDDVDTGRFGN